MPEFDLTPIRERVNAYQTKRSGPDWADAFDDAVEVAVYVPALLAEVERLRERLADAEHEREVLREGAADLDERLQLALKAEGQVRRDHTAALRLLGQTCDERDRYRQHSVQLNSIGWRLAQALGQVPDGADAVTGDPERLLAALIAERGQLRYERRLLGVARMVLDRQAEYPNLHQVDRERLAAEAAEIAQRIVDEIGHSVTDEPALGPHYREQIAALRAELAAARGEALDAVDTLATLDGADGAVAPND